MTLPRPTSDHQRAALKLAVRRQIKASGGQGSAAVITRVRQQQLSEYASQRADHEQVHMPLDVALDLMLDSGEPVLIRALCTLAGGVFVELPSADSDGAWATEISELIKEFGEANSKALRALSVGNTITAEEIARYELLREMNEFIEKAVALKTHMERVVEDGGRGDLS